MPRTQKSLKTPLRYPGGKSRAVVKLLQYLPDLSQVKEFREPFLGGGSVALEITKRYPNLKTIWVNDLYEPLYNFWSELQHSGHQLQGAIFDKKEEHPDRETARTLFNESKQHINDKEKSNFDRAVAFYIVNKCSFSGLTESSSFSPQASESNFSVAGIDRLHEYSELIQDWIITNLSYERLLTDDWDNRGIFTYMDPPYDIKDNLYGRKGGMHKGFDHDEFAKNCDRYTAPMLISYNSDQIVKDRFKEWTVAEFAHTYTMRSVGCYNKDQATRKELVLLNYEM
jgi:DNA adenine methylase|tara:strand:+ start:570 stop:1421 length:852 start_codon:yes stop_codon:yes gene_type:complete